ncbi:hypothetical protein CDD81_6274 [Ophiocordyceps australis]|uniref:Phytocyanin domain-containing protein n=1 Tax=Ophiocordyceps australis TaxID=1399860 RepID=A0A2C5Y672_9HYPO|nr:hypothetical protein CDD81_6274 [Ophiocordyceps australis]
MKLSIALGMGAALAPLAIASQEQAAAHSNNLLTRMFKPENKLNDRTVKVRTGKSKDRESVTANKQTEIILIWANPGGGAERTQINEKVTVTETVTAGGGGIVGGVETSSATGAGATHTVTVGGDQGLAFNPQEIRANAGDMIIYKFMAQKHSATQSSFDDPCVPLPGGFDTDLIENANNSIVPAPEVAMQVMTTKPIWMFCKAKTHCGKGMTMSINPTAEKTHSLFQQMAIAKNGTGDAAPITGGAPAAGGEAGKEGEKAGGEKAGGVERATSSLGGGEAAQPTGMTGGVGQTGGNTAAGKGTLRSDGSCDCVAACSAGSFPSVEQGNGSSGGMGGFLSTTNMGAMSE